MRPIGFSGPTDGLPREVQERIYAPGDPAVASLVVEDDDLGVLVFLLLCFCMGVLVGLLAGLVLG